MPGLSLYPEFPLRNSVITPMHVYIRVVHGDSLLNFRRWLFRQHALSYSMVDVVVPRMSRLENRTKAKQIEPSVQISNRVGNDELQTSGFAGIFTCIYSILNLCIL